LLLLLLGLAAVTAEVPAAVGWAAGAFVEPSPGSEKALPGCPATHAANADASHAERPTALPERPAASTAADGSAGASCAGEEAAPGLAFKELARSHRCPFPKGCCSPPPRRLRAAA
jgi:hypothetical protein